MNRCSRCGKKIWIWDNRWSLSNENEKPHDYWHTKCAKPIHELPLISVSDMNDYVKSITNFTFGVEGS